MNPFEWQLPVKRSKNEIQHPLSRGLRAMSGALPAMAEEALEQKKESFKSIVHGAAFHAKIRGQWNRKSLQAANFSKDEVNRDH